MIQLGNAWDLFLQNESKQPYFQNLMAHLAEDAKTHTIYPPKENWFYALGLTPPEQVHVVILGQDPYPGENQAHGLCFSVQPGIAIPRSLNNIYQEIQSDLGIDNTSKGGTLTHWAKQGVLMINTVMTVRAGEPNSHKNFGWEQFTDHLIEKLNASNQPIVFLLWGNHAQSKIPLLTNPRHLILTAAHPSPLSARRGFFGCQHFSKANAYLLQNHLPPIDWSV